MYLMQGFFTVINIISCPMSTDICRAERIGLSAFSSVSLNRPTGIKTSHSPTGGLIYAEVPNPTLVTNESKSGNTKSETSGRKKKNPTMGRSLGHVIAEREELHSPTFFQRT